MVFEKKAISPVVATALLLVVAVVAVVGFQSWFTTYQSGINSKVEQESQAGAAITVERLDDDGRIYVRNGAVGNVTATSFKVSVTGGASCSNTSTVELAGQAITEVPMSGTCTLTEGGKYDVVVVTTNGVASSTQIAR